MPPLRKIDCIMVPVGDLKSASAFYTRVFGLRRRWTDEDSIGFGMPDTDAEIVLNTTGVDGVHYLVDDVPSAVAGWERAGCVIRVPPFDIAIGKCAVLEDPFGNAVRILDMSKGERRLDGES